MRSPSQVAALCALGVTLISCAPSPSGRVECDNLDESNCMLPFPSDYYRVTTGDGAHVEFPEAAMPVHYSGEPIAVAGYRVSGFSTVTPIFFALDGATLAGTTSKRAIDGSLDASSKTVIVDAETGELHPHWIELDYQSEDAGRPTFVIRVARPLEYARRYIVAISGLVDDAGKTLAATPGFAALRDDDASGLAGIEARRKHFEDDIFPVLKTAGVARARLQLAWDFTTTTQDATTRQLLTARARMMAIIGDAGPEYSITSIEDRADGPIAKVLIGIAKVPDFLHSKDADGIKRIRLDDDGLPTPVGVRDVEFTLQIPRSALTSPTRAAMMQYGHGFLGSKDEAYNGWLTEWANRDNFLILATDMEGMHEEAGITWFQILPGKASLAPELSGWPIQGALNHLALQRMMKGRFVAATDLRYTNSGTPYYDPARMYYHGNSQGGTMGNIVIATSSDITRAILGVPGCALSFLVSRASQWSALGPVIESGYSGPRDMQIVMGLVQQAFDRFEPTHFAQRVTVDPFDGLPSHQVLLQVAKEDAQVNNDISELLGRVVGARLVQPALRPVWGLEPVTAPTRENAYVEWDFGVADNPSETRPAADETDTHGFVRKNVAAQAQGWHFLETGEVLHTCDGPCNPL